MPESSQTSDDRSSLVKYAARILTARPYFRYKLKEKLFLRAGKMNIPDPSDTINSILDDLEKSGYLNDDYLLEGFVRRQLSKGYGPRIISLKLGQLGMDRSKINSFLRSYPSEKEELEAIRKYSGKYPKLDRRRLVSRLFSRGFSPQLVRKLFDGNWLED